MLLMIQAEGEPLVQTDKPHYALHGCKPVNALLIRICIMTQYMYVNIYNKIQIEYTYSPIV